MKKHLNTEDAKKAGYNNQYVFRPESMMTAAWM